MTIDSRFEAFLARVYVDPAFRAAFLRDPQGEALLEGLTPEQASSLAEITHSSRVPPLMRRPLPMGEV